MKRAICFFVALILLFSLCSCTGATQLDERLIVQGVGIDVTDDGYEATVMFLDTENKKDQAPGTGIIYSKGKTVMDAIANTVSQKGKEPLFGQNLFLIIGNELAKKGIGNEMNFFTNYYESRPTIGIYISKATAKEILSVENISASMIDKLAETETVSGRIVMSTLMDFVSDEINETQQPKTALIEYKDDVVTASGTAVFKDSKLVGELDNEESLGALLLTDSGKIASDVISMDNQEVSFSLSECKTKIKTSIVDKKPFFDIKITAKADIYELNEFAEDINVDIEKRLVEICKRAIEKCTKKYKTDIFGFGKRLCQSENKYYQGIENFDDELQNAQFNITAEVDVPNMSDI